MIYFVGIGPGDPELLTIKALKYMRKADYAIYVAGVYVESVLPYLSAGCRKLHVKDFPISSQVAFIKAHPDSVIIRFHTGDLSLESGCMDLIDFLRAENIPFKCVPGISAVSAVAARLGVDYLLDGVSNNFSVVLPSDNRLVPIGQNVGNMAKSGGAVVVLGINPDNIHLVVSELKAVGKNKSDVVCLASRVSQEGEKIVITTLFLAEKMMRKHKIGRFTMLLAGNFLESVSLYTSKSLLESWKREGIIVES